MTTCCSIFGLIFLVITNLTILIAFATPYWVIMGATTGVTQGLWAQCVQDRCTWVFEDGYDSLNNKVDIHSDWWLATTGLACGGLAMGLFALLLATVALCCDCRGCNASHAIGGLLFISFLALGTSCVVFGVCANKYENVEIDPEFANKFGLRAAQDEGLVGSISAGFNKLLGKRFGWSFWLNIGASGVALLTSLIYIIDGRNKHDA